MAHIPWCYIFDKVFLIEVISVFGRGGRRTFCVEGKVTSDVVKF